MDFEEQKRTNRLSALVAQSKPHPVVRIHPVDLDLGYLPLSHFPLIVTLLPLSKVCKEITNECPSLRTRNSGLEKWFSG